MSTGASWRAWRLKVFASTWIAYAGLYFGRKSFYVVKGDLETGLGFDPEALGDLGFAYLVAYTVGQFVSAALGPRTGPRVLLLLGLAVAAGANLVFGLATNFWTFAAFMVVNGLGQATGWPATMGTLAHWTVRQERGTLLGFWSTCYQLGGALASGWAGFWLMRAGWRGAFLAGAAVVLGAWTVVLFFQRNRPEDVGLAAPQEPESSAPRVAPRVRRYDLALTICIIGVFYFFLKFVRYALWSWAPYFLRRDFALSGEDAAYLSTLFDVAGFVGVIVAGVVSDRFFAGRRALPSLLLLVGMVLGALFLYLVGPLGVVWFAVGLAWTGFMLYGPDSLLTGAGAIEVGSRRVAITAAGVINGMGSLGSALQEKVVPAVYVGAAHGVSAVLVMLLVASGAATLAIALVVWRNRRGRSDL